MCKHAIYEALRGGVAHPLKDSDFSIIYNIFCNSAIILKKIREKSFKRAFFLYVCVCVLNLNIHPEANF